MNSPALPLPPGPLLAAGRPAPQRRHGTDGSAPRRPARPLTAPIGPQPLGTAPYRGGRQRPLGALVLALHGVAVWGLMQLGPVRDTLREVAPVMVSLVSTPQATPAAPPPLPAAPKPVRPEPTPLAPPPVVIQAAAPAPPPPAVAQAEPVPMPAPAPAPLAPPAPAPAPTATLPSPAPAPVATGPRMLPSAAVQYLVPPVAEVPRASRRLNETGRVLVRVLITEAGLPDRLSIERSSGFARLDEAALAAVRKARFRPYTENGQAQSGWALVPVSFELDP